MPHQCVHCSKIYPDASKELLEGCSCGSHFFFYIKKEQLEKVKEAPLVVQLNENEKKKVEKDVREIMGVEREDVPVILDLESVRILGPGKFEIDVANLFSHNKPIIYKLEEGKYIIDLASTLNTNLKK
ncbi:MAG: Zn-ribbon containing protein [Nanoarchaeota archaeon]|nr:Zn-ribbon containing protein [Nanoarchaeota archaeon]